MAVRDTEPYLPECLDSICEQTYQNWELIAVNDHSADRSPEILDTYASKDHRIRVFHSERPLLIPSLKYGYRQARGTLINRMDSDDRMPPDKLEVMVAEWNQNGKGTIIAGGTEHFVDQGTVGDGFRRYERWLNRLARENIHFQEIYKECVIPSHCWLLHRDDFEQAGGFEPEVYPEDYDLCFRFYREGFRVIGLDKVLHFWRDRSERISRTWDCYQDNRYFELKLQYFFELDRLAQRPLVLWGAGRNGKDMARLLLEREEEFFWVCDNDKKIGKDVYGVRMDHFERVAELSSPQILIVVSSPPESRAIRAQLKSWGKRPVEDFWFFV